MAKLEDDEQRAGYGNGRGQRVEHTEVLQSLFGPAGGTRAKLRNSIHLGTIPSRENPGRPPSLVPKVSANQAGCSRPVCAAGAVNAATYTRYRFPGTAC